MSARELDRFRRAQERFRRPRKRQNRQESKPQASGLYSRLLKGRKNSSRKSSVSASSSRNWIARNASTSWQQSQNHSLNLSLRNLRVSIEASRRHPALSSSRLAWAISVSHWQRQARPSEESFKRHPQTSPTSAR